MTGAAEIRFAGIPELAQMLGRRRISAAELTTHTLELLETYGMPLRAVAALPRERAIREARAADRRLALARDHAIRADDSRAGGASASQLLGIPYGAKDLLAARGAPTTWGAETHREQEIDEDAAAVAVLRRAGAVLAAKLACVALAGAGGNRYPSASLQGATRNPWDAERWSGGSSSGSAAAVAAGLVPYALASETSGSIGTPSAFCGVTGLRPTYGLVSRRGAMPLSWTLDKIGPIARTAMDCATVLRALAPSFRRLAPRSTAARLRSVRIGLLAGELADHAAPETARALQSAVGELRPMAGRGMTDVAVPGLPYRAMVETIYNAEGAEAFAELIESGAIDALSDAKQKAGLREALEIRARDYLRAMRLRTVLRAGFERLFTEVDLLLSFGRGSTATGINERRDGARGWNAGLVPAGNLAGLPAIFFPCGLGTDGLPVGMQLVGPPRSEALLVGVVETYQRSTGHHLRRPP
jgi:aspartyl-tRNA(Asn)/glutamyl-tRNA(Gln) amidotransferase subunit A